MDSQVTITSAALSPMIIDFESKKIILERTSGTEINLGMLPMEIDFADITDIELRKPKFIIAGGCNIIVKGIRYMTKTSNPGDATLYTTKDFAKLESALSRVLSECGLSSFKEFGSANAKKVIYADVASEFEKRKKCKACGHMFCYSPLDVAKNNALQKQASYSGIAAVTGAMSGAAVTSAVNQMNANNARSQIVNFNVCPKCNSRDLQLLTKEEYEAEMQAKATPAQTVVQQAAPSAAEELKKFKELLDMGIITQEEFDAKKKQLLGL